MLSLTPKELKKEAALRIATTPGDHRKLIWLYGGVSLGAGLLSLLIDFITGLMIENTGGLSDLGLRAILQSISTVFALGINLLLPLWMLGFMRTVLRLSRQERVQPGNLTAGFPRWGVLLRLCLLQGITCFAVFYLTLQAATVLFSMTSASDSLLTLLTPYAEDTALLEAALDDPTLMKPLLKAMLPMLILWGVLLAAVMIPVVYGMRLSFYRIADDDRPGALLSMSQSRKMMKGNKWKLFKLDISFWWYYLLQILCALLLELPAYLANTLLPVSQDILMLIAGVLQALGSFWLYHKFLLQMEVSYALFYDTLYESHKAPPVQTNFYRQ